VASFKILAINERFELLRQLGNVFVVKPEHLKPMLEEGQLARIDPAILHSFIVNRADFKQAKLDSLLVFKGLPITSPAENQPLTAAYMWERGLETAQTTFEEVGDTFKRIIQ
jgi:hypothetical protein